MTGDGWGLTGQTNRWHYFEGGESHCARWLYRPIMGALQPAVPTTSKANVCNICAQRLAREQGAARKEPHAPDRAPRP